MSVFENHPYFMNTHYSPLVLGFGLGVALVTPAFAQEAEPVASAPSTASASGLLGKRYVAASFILTETQDIDAPGYGLATAINLPLSARFDVGALFAHNWTEGDTSDHFQDLAAYVTAHGVCGDFRPFAKASLGYQWWREVSDDPWYQVDVGSEYLLTERLSLSAQLSWSEYLAADWNGGEWGVGTRANYWVTTNIATSATVAYTEGGTWTYGLGVVVRF